MANHSELSVINSLSRKNDVRIAGSNVMVLSDKTLDLKTGEVIDNPRKTNDLGNKSWGKISYLVNYCGYHQFFVADF